MVPMQPLPQRRPNGTREQSQLPSTENGSVMPPSPKGMQQFMKLYYVEHEHSGEIGEFTQQLSKMSKIKISCPLSLPSRAIASQADKASPHVYRCRRFYR